MLASLSPFEREQRALAQLADEVGLAHVLGTPEFAQLEKDDHVAAAIYRQDMLEQLVESLPADELFIARKRSGSRGHQFGVPRRISMIRISPRAVASRRFIIRSWGATSAIRAPSRAMVEAPHFSYTRRAPRLGEHTEEVLARVGVSR